MLCAHIDLLIWPRQRAIPDVEVVVSVGHPTPESCGRVDIGCHDARGALVLRTGFLKPVHDQEVSSLLRNRRLADDSPLAIKLHAAELGRVPVGTFVVKWTFEIGRAACVRPYQQGSSQALCSHVSEAVERHTKKTQRERTLPNQLVHCSVGHSIQSDLDRLQKGSNALQRQRR